MSNDHIPTSEILKDIADTQREIAQYEREIPALETLGDRMSMFKADFRRHGIRDRQTFIARLEGLLAERGHAKQENCQMGCACPLHEEGMRKAHEELSNQENQGV